MAIALGILYIIGMAFFTIAFLVEWIRSRKQNRVFLKFGLMFGIAVVGLDVFTVIITPASWTPLMLVGFALEPIVFIRITGFTMLGMYYCAGMGLPSSPLLIQRFGIASEKEDIPTEIVAVLPPQNDNSQSHSSDLETPSVQENGVSSFEAANRPIAESSNIITVKESVFAGLIFSAVAVLYTVVLFLLTTPHMSEAALEKFGRGSVNFQSVILVIEVAIAEEIVFRLGIQNYLAKYVGLQGKYYWTAIVLTSVLWTLGHSGVLDPDWVKLAQIFPIGLAFGWLFKKYGVESAIVAHSLFNVVLAFLSDYLIK